MDTRTNNNQLITRQAHALFAVLGGGAAIAIALQTLFSFALPTNAETIPLVTEELRAVRMPNLFESISLNARAAFVFELKTGTVLYAKNENEKLPLASVTKLMTALVARERMSESALLTLVKNDLDADGDSGLRPGERWRLANILNVMLLVSSNDAARAVAGFVGSDGQVGNGDLARARFVQMMNEKARTLGLTQTEFYNESGLDLNGAQNGGYGSARDVAQLFAELWKKYPESIEVTSHKDARVYSQDEIAHFLSNTNEIVGRIPGLVASKTGFTDISGGNLAVIFDRGVGEPIVVVVLGSGYKERFLDVEMLVSATMQAE